MKNYKIVLKEVDDLHSITCDICEKEYIDTFEMQEFLSWKNSCGYSSVFGDGEIISIDICQHCQKAFLGKFFKRHGNYISDGGSIFDN